MAGRTQRQRIASYAVCIHDGHVLLCRASARTEAAGWWWLPGGGVDFGEHPEEAVVREVLEETGLSVVVTNFLGVLADVRDRQRVLETVHTVRLCYEVSSPVGTLRPEANGTTDLPAWIDLAELDQLQLAPYARAALALALP